MAKSVCPARLSHENVSTVLCMCRGDGLRVRSVRSCRRLGRQRRVPPTGIWDSGNNWSGDNTTPGNSDTATFNLAQTYAVNFAADPLAIQNLTVSAGTVTFQNSGGVQTLDVTSGGALDVFIGTATLNLGTTSNTLPVNLMVGDVLFVTSGGILNINAGSVATVATTARW